MTPSQITLLRELIDSTDYRVYVKLNGKRELATQLRMDSKKSQAILQCYSFSCNPYQLTTSMVDIYRVSRPLEFFSSGNNTLNFQGLTWLCIKPREVRPGDILLNAKNLKDTYLATTMVSEVDNTIFAFCPIQKEIISLIYIEDVVAIRAVF
jgi:hypothetical protein